MQYITRFLNLNKLSRIWFVLQHKLEDSERTQIEQIRSHHSNRSHKLNIAFNSVNLICEIENWQITRKKMFTRFRM